MFKKYLNIIFLFSIIGMLPIHYVYAKNMLIQEPKTSIIRITSTDPNQPNIKFDGSLLLSTHDKDATITEIHTTTPWEVIVTEEYVRYIIKTGLQNPMLKVQTIERTNRGDDIRSTGTGHVFDGIESNCNESGCITSGIYVLN